MIDLYENLGAMTNDALTLSETFADFQENEALTFKLF